MYTIIKLYFKPAKSIGHDAHAEGADHAAHTEDGNSDTPDDGANPIADRLTITLHPGVVEERSQFLKFNNRCMSENTGNKKESLSLLLCSKTNQFLIF